MTTHLHVDRLAAAAIDFALAPAERSDLAGHLATCPVCRSLAAGYRADASRLQAVAFAEPPAWVRSNVLSAATRPAARTIHPWRLLATAALLLATLIGTAFAMGAWNQRPTLVVTVPTRSPSPAIASPTSGPTTAPSPTPNEAAPSGEPTPYEPPQAECPAPSGAVPLPDVTVSVGGARSIVATRGSSTTVTCSTTGSVDVVRVDPVQSITAASGDRLTLVLPEGWTFLHIEGYDAPAGQDSPSNITPAIDTPSRPSRIEMPGPGRLGDSIVRFSFWMVRNDGRVVGSLDISVLVHVASAGSSEPPGGTPTILALPEAAIRTVPGDEVLPSLTAFGSRVFDLVFDARTQMGGTLTMRDVATGTSANLITLDKTHTVGQMAASQDRLTWVETWRTNPSPPTQDVPGCVDAGKPLNWRITSLNTSTFVGSTIATGVSRRTAYSGQCADVDSPVIATDGDRIAYSLEGATVNRSGDRIELRTVTGSEIYAIETVGKVEDLRLSGSTLAYRENTDASTGTLIFGTGRLMIVRGDSGLPVEIDGRIADLALGGTRIAWVRADATVGSIWTMTLDAVVPTQIAAPIDDCLELVAAHGLAVDDDVVAWSELARIKGYSAGGCCTAALAIWASGEPTARYIEGFGSPPAASISGGWLLWNTSRASLTWHDDPGRRDGFYGVPLVALASPWP